MRKVLSNMKKTSLMLSAVAVITLICAAILFAGASGAVSDDPADNYTVRTAEYEDNGIKLWFDHSFRKNFTSDRKSTGMNTYSVYMAKNEIESAQFVLCSAVDKPGNNCVLPIYYIT